MQRAYDKVVELVDIVISVGSNDSDFRRELTSTADISRPEAPVFPSCVVFSDPIECRSLNNDTNHIKVRNSYCLNIRISINVRFPLM